MYPHADSARALLSLSFDSKTSPRACAAKPALESSRQFSGKFSDRENFRDVFRAVIHRREDLSPVMKLHYFRTHLSGDALEKIKSLPISGDNYERAS